MGIAKAWARPSKQVVDCGFKGEESGVRIADLGFRIANLKARSQETGVRIADLPCGISPLANPRHSTGLRIWEKAENSGGKD
jgi:hypothetical protein